LRAHKARDPIWERLSVSYAQLVLLPLADGRTAERRIVNLAARMREPGAVVVDAEVGNLSTDGFMAESKLNPEPGANVWLKLPGLEPRNCTCIWAEDGKAGFQFAAPLHPGTVEMIVQGNRKPLPRGHFGAR